MQKSYQTTYDFLLKALDQHEGEVFMLNEQTPLEVQRDFYNLLKEYQQDIHRFTPEVWKSLIQDFEQIAEDDFESKKNLLIKLSMSKEVEVFRYLQHYAECAEDPMKPYARIALLNSEVMMKADLLDIHPIYITTGMGGRDGKLRYDSLCPSEQLMPFQDYQRDVIKREFYYAIEQQAHGEIELFEIAENYVHMQLLLPLRQHVNLLMENLVKECNQYGGFLANFWQLTNEAALTEEQIAKYLKEYEKHYCTGR